MRMLSAGTSVAPCFVPLFLRFSGWGCRAFRFEDRDLNRHRTLRPTAGASLLPSRGCRAANWVKLVLGVSDDGWCGLRH